MKNNLIRLLGIAFAVAIVSTALFYFFVVSRLASVDTGGRATVVAARRIPAGAQISEADVKTAVVPGTAAVEGALASPSLVVGQYALDAFEAGETITGSRIAMPASRQAAGARIPSGMRAVSLQVEDSSGVVSLLRPGQRVDLYAVGENARARGEVELRTVLQNVEVLAASGEPDGNRARQGGQVVTLLARPADAELLALADAGGRVRLVLRNSSDQGVNQSRKLAYSRVLDPRGGDPPARRGSVPAVQATGGKDQAPGVLLQVRVVGAEPGAIDELNPQLTLPLQRETMQVSPFRPGAVAESALERLLEGERVQVLSTSRLLTAGNREVSIDSAAEDRTSDRSYSLRITFAAARERGKLRLRVAPEVRLPFASGEAVRRISTDVELAEGQSCLLTGLLPSNGEDSAGWLFPGGKSKSPRELVVIVTPEANRPVQSASAR